MFTVLDFTLVFQVARSLGILDEVNRMKVVPGTSPGSRQTNKNARYMEVSTVNKHSCVLKVLRVCCCHTEASL